MCFMTSYDQRFRVSGGFLLVQWRAMMGDGGVRAGGSGQEAASFSLSLKLLTKESQPVCKIILFSL